MTGPVRRSGQGGRVVLLLWACCVGGAAGQEAPPRAELSAAQLRSRLAEAQAQVHSVYVVYRSAPGSYDDPSFPPGTYLHRTVAAKAPFYLHHVSAHGHDRLDWQDDPLQQRCYVTADHWYNVNPVNRLYSEGSLRPGDPLPGSMPGELFFLTTGLWPPSRRAPPRLAGRPIVLREVAGSRDHAVVRPDQESVDGRWCHVLEWPGVERLWLDVGRGCALLARENLRPPDGILMQRLEAGGHREAAPGVWLPTWIRNVQFDYLSATPEGRRRRLKDASVEVLEVRANDVEDALFEFRPPAGSLLVRHVAEPPEQVRPGGVEHLDHLAAWVERNAAPGPPNREPPWGYWGGGAAFGLVLASELWRLRRSRNSPRAGGPGGP